MTTLSCVCGQVCIEFPSTPQPKTHHECCCTDCRERFLHLERLGGPPVTKPNQTIYTLDNKMNITKGRDKLYLYKLTADSMLTNMASSCCHSYLMARHAQFHGPGTIATAPDFSNLTLACPTTNDDSKPMARWFVTDLEKMNVNGDIMDPTVPHFWVTSQGQVASNVEHWAEIFQAQTGAIAQPVPDDGKPGESFEDIVESIGQDNVVIVNHQDQE